MTKFDAREERLRNDVAGSIYIINKTFFCFVRLHYDIWEDKHSNKIGAVVKVIVVTLSFHYVCLKKKKMKKKPNI